MKLIKSVLASLTLSLSVINPAVAQVAPLEIIHAAGSYTLSVTIPNFNPNQKAYGPGGILSWYDVTYAAVYGAMMPACVKGDTIAYRVHLYDFVNDHLRSHTLTCNAAIRLAGEYGLKPNVRYVSPYGLVPTLNLDTNAKSQRFRNFVQSALN